MPRQLNYTTQHTLVMLDSHFIQCPKIWRVSETGGFTTQWSFVIGTNMVKGWFTINFFSPNCSDKSTLRMPKVDSPAIFVRCKSSANGFRAGVEVGSTVGWMAEMHRHSQCPFYGRPWSTGNDEFWMNFVVPVAPDPYSHTRLFFWTSVTANSTWISTRTTKLYQSKESIKWWDDCGRMDKTIVINNKVTPWPAACGPQAWSALSYLILSLSSSSSSSSSAREF